MYRHGNIKTVRSVTVTGEKVPSAKDYLKSGIRGKYRNVAMQR